MLIKSSSFNISKVCFIKHVFILLTPFHKRVAEELWGELLNSPTTLVLYGKFVDAAKFECRKYNIGEVIISKKEFKYYSLNSIIDFRNKIRRIKFTIDQIIKKYCLRDNLTVYIGSEKDLYTQFLLSKLFNSKNNNTLIAFDEGSGFYRMQNQFITFCYNLIYIFFSTVFFGQKINYVYTLGTDSRIDVVYARLPHLLPVRRKNTKYVHIDPLQEGSNRNYSENNRSFINMPSLLILSFPSHDVFGDDNLKVSCIEKLINKFNGDYKISIKPHPRENIDFLDDLIREYPNVNVLDETITAEELNYFEYTAIINFYSSVVIDLLACGYPKSKIVTIGFKNSTDISFFNETKYYNIAQINDVSLEN